MGICLLCRWSAPGPQPHSRFCNRYPPIPQALMAMTKVGPQVLMQHSMSPVVDDKFGCGEFAALFVRNDEEVRDGTDIERLAHRPS